MKFSISVIIPAYNVEKFIEKSIFSALSQTEVIEVIVVNDGSSDGTLVLIENLQSTNSKIKVYHHPNKINKGRSASRNLGISKTTGNIIAFLDADDFYLPNRFTNDKIVFEKNLNVDGVYNAVGFHFYRAYKAEEECQFVLNTVSKPINPENLFKSLISSKYGYLHLNGLTVKKSVFDAIGLFNESLVVAEDSDIIFKMALKCRLKSGIIDKPIARRGVHDDNIFTREDLYKTYNVRLYESLVNWGCKNEVSLKNIDTLLNWLWFYKFRTNKNILTYIFDWICLFGNNPKLMFSKFSVKYFPVIRLRQKYFPFLYKE